MATSACVVTGVLPSTVSSVDLTKTGFGTPDCAIIFSDAVYSGANPAAGVTHCVGFWSGNASSQVSTSLQITDARSSSAESNRGADTNDAVVLLNNIPSSLLTASVSAITDGIRITVSSENTTVERQVSALLLKGVTNSYAGFKQLGTVTSYDITDPGFKPDLVFMSSLGANTIAPSAYGLFSLGVAHNNSSDSVTQGGVLTGDNDGASVVESDQYASNQYCVGQVFASTLYWGGSLGSFDASGFTITTSANPASDYVYYLAIKLANPEDAFVLNFDTEVATGTKAYTGAGFTPDALCIIGSAATAIDTVTGGGVMMRGLADDTTEWTDVFHNEDGVSTSNVNTTQASKVLSLDLDDGTSDAEATVSTFDADGWTLNYSVASSTARKMIAVAIGDGATPANTISLTDLTDDRVYQTSGTDVGLTISGTYTGTPTAIQARIVQDGTETEVVTWTTIDAAPTGGAFSGTIVVPNGGPYNVDVRFSNETGVVSNGANGFLVGDLYLILGQSNASEWFAHGTAGAANSQARIYSDGWRVADGDDDGAVSFCNKLITDSSIPVGLVNSSADGGVLRQEAEAGGFGYYLSTADARADHYLDLQVDLSAVGGSVAGAIVVNGEGDANSGVVTHEEFEGSLTALYGYLRTDTGDANLPIAQVYLGQRVGVSDANMQAVREAQIDVIAGDANAYGVVVADLPLRDTVHYSDYTVMAERCAQVFARLNGDETYSDGPSISAVNKVNTTTIDVTLSHDAGTDFTPTTGITGFDVLDGVTPVTINSAVRNNATTIRLTLASAIIGDATVRYQYGDAWTITGAVKDNSSMTLPIVPLRELVAGADIDVTLGAIYSESIAQDLQAVLGAVGSDMGSGIAESLASGLSSIQSAVSVTIDSAEGQSIASSMTAVAGGIGASLGSAEAESIAASLLAIESSVSITLPVAEAEGQTSDLSSTQGGIVAAINEAVSESIASAPLVSIGSGPIILSPVVVEGGASDLSSVLSGLSATLGDADAEASAGSPTVALSAVVASIGDALVEAVANSLTTTIGAGPIILSDGAAWSGANALTVTITATPVNIGAAVAQADALKPNVNVGDFAITLDDALAFAYAPAITVTVGSLGGGDIDAESIVLRYWPESTVYKPTYATPVYYTIKRNFNQ